MTQPIANIRPRAAPRAASRAAPGAEDSRARILDAAEQVFAAAGYDGAGMKAIAAKAEVAQGLLHYHFDNKERLYEAVVERRSALINEGRIALLDAVDLDARDAVEQVFRAFFSPPLGPEGGGADYARIFAGLAVGVERDKALVRRCYDASARRFLDALQAAAPGATKADAAWAYTFALGALIAVVGRDERLARLADGDATLDAVEEVVERLTAFAAAGFRSLAGEGPATD